MPVALEATALVQRQTGKKSSAAPRRESGAAGKWARGRAAVRADLCSSDLAIVERPGELRAAAAVVQVRLHRDRDEVSLEHLRGGGHEAETERSARDGHAEVGSGGDQRQRDRAADAAAAAAGRMRRTLAHDSFVTCHSPVCPVIGPPPTPPPCWWLMT